MDFRAVSSFFFVIVFFTVHFWSFKAVENLTRGHLIHGRTFRTSFYLKADSVHKEDSIDTLRLSNDSRDDKLLNGASFIAIVILGVLENIFEICPIKRTTLNTMVGTDTYQVDMFDHTKRKRIFPCQHAPEVADT